jgi:predicted ATP-dependent protease
LDDLTEEVRSKLEVHPVETLGEALPVTLRDTSLEEGRLLFGTNRDQEGTRPQ